MKKILTFITIISLIATLYNCGSDCDNPIDETAITNCLPSNLQNNIIAYYLFANGSLQDKSSNGNHLINTTSAISTTDRNGNVNCAYKFNPSDFLSHTNTSFLNNLTNISISVWFESADVTGSNYELLVGRDNGSGLHCPDTFGDFSLGLYDCNRPVFGYNEKSIWDNWQNTWTSCNDGVTYYNSSWHHVVATYDSGTLKIYVDGVLTTDAQSGTCGPSMLFSGDLKVGGNYTGKIDDVIIYDITLTQTQITDLFNETPCCFDN